MASAAASDGQSSAGRWLTKAYRELGQDGSALVHDMLIDGKTAKQIAEARGKVGPSWERYYFRRLQECLGTLSQTYGTRRRDLRDFPICPKEPRSSSLSDLAES